MIKRITLWATYCILFLIRLTDEADTPNLQKYKPFILALDLYFFCTFYGQMLVLIRHHDVVGRVPAFQSGYPGSIPGGIRDFNLYPGTVSVSCFCFLSCVVSGDGPDIMLTRDSGWPAFVHQSSVLVHSLGIPTGI